MRDACGTDQCAQLHQGLVVDPRRLPVLGYDGRGDAPDSREIARAFWFELWGEEPGKYTGNVRVDQRRRVLVGERGDGTGGVASDAGKGAQRRDTVGNRASVRIAHLAGEGVQVASAGVVAESLPSLHHPPRARFGDGVQRREAIQEPLVVVDDA